MRDEIMIGQRAVGRAHRPFVIAELSGNHNQSLDRALALVEAAAQAGADAVKLQTYTADTMTLDIRAPGFVITEKKSLWYGKSLYALYQEASTPWEWHTTIFSRCRELGMLAFSTPFDFSAVDFLESLDAPCYKIASFENTDHALLRKVAATGKPAIVSTGMASLAELDEAVNCLRAAGCEQFVLLKCTSSYPALPTNSNLKTLPHLRDLFQCEVGLSDHTLGIGAAVASVALGATVIEKHFTLARADGGVDSAFSMEPLELAQLVKESTSAWQALGEIRYGTAEEEKSSLQFRRSLYVVADMRAGDVLSEKNLRAIRPGYGLPPKYYDTLLGKQVMRDVAKGTPVSWDLLSANKGNASNG